MTGNSEVITSRVSASNNAGARIQSVTDGNGELNESGGRKGLLALTGSNCSHFLHAYCGIVSELPTIRTVKARQEASAGHVHSPIRAY
jgi:hypothetical protein